MDKIEAHMKSLNISIEKDMMKQSLSYREF